MYLVEPLSTLDDRTSFESGEAALDDFLRKFARQNEERGLSRTFVAITESSTLVLGYYTLSAGSVAPDALPEGARRKLPRYPVPVAHLGRLAVDRRHHGQGLGSLLLVDALTQSLDVSKRLGLHAVEVLAKTDLARGFYLRHGFTSLTDDPNHLYVSMREVAASFRAR